VAKQCQLHFSVNLQETRLFIRGFSSHATVLTNTKQLPIGQWLNASGMHLVNLENFKNFAEYTPLSFNHLQKLHYLCFIRH
jgi:hypothetical protein